jgi:hypothetical protein
MRRRELIESASRDNVPVPPQLPYGDIITTGPDNQPIRPRIFTTASRRRSRSRSRRSPRRSRRSSRRPWRSSRRARRSSRRPRWRPWKALVAIEFGKRCRGKRLPAAPREYSPERSRPTQALLLNFQWPACAGAHFDGCAVKLAAEWSGPTTVKAATA